MNTRRSKSVRRIGLLLALLGTFVTSGLAGAGTAPPIPTGPKDSNGNWAVPDYYTTANWANSPPLAKFVDTLPGLGTPNNLGQYLSVGKPDIVTYPGSDYYEIELVEYRERMHSDLPLPGTTLRGYVQVNNGTDTSICGGTAQPACSAIHNTLTPDPVKQLGPTLVTQRDRPVRIKFTNKLPTGPSGDLFIPVDTSIMGSGTGPATAGAARGEGSPCDNTVEPNNCASYTQNRSAIHLHGGRTPWISDGTPHQWITPAGEVTPFTKGVSFANVPDMPDPGDGSMTYYYTNQQSARLMFYHEHAFGITRLNPYIGVAAGYVITDQWEQDLVARGLIPADQIPLIIQDKTFVDDTPTTKFLYNTTTKLFDIPITVPQVRATDPLWNWGSGTPDANGIKPPVKGDLWLPHVYMPAQNPLAGSGGVNPFGRWMYGPWFYPATAVPKGPVANPYYDADCGSPFPAVYANCSTPGQPPQIPGTPHPSMGMEAFQDSAVVNGTAFPSLTVDPRAYRFRILNAASDRFWNLSFYVADPAQTSPDTRLLAAGKSNLTEVKMAPASPALAAANNWPAGWPTDGREEMVPDPGTCAPGGVNCSNLGPSFFQIGTEGGFLPQPDIRVPQPVTYITDPTAFWVGIVDKTGLALGPAERADVIVDFSAYAGKTLILYNDAPAAWPARVPGYDYYTGAPDLRDSGGYGTGGTFNPITGFWDNGTGPLVGYAPNTRTVMQVIVNPGTPVPFNQAALEAEFTSSAAETTINPAPVKTLFERAQEPIIVGQAAYATTYPNSYFPPNFPWEGVNQINDHYLQFVTLAGQPVRVTTEPKGIHDEMGASFDPIYGRMSGNLAMQLPNPTTLNALLVLYGYSDLPTETINNSPTVNVQVLGSGTDPIPWQVTDGTQIWKISHNGVDTHPIHFHIFDVQLINRVGWDGQIALPEPNEMGWKDTIKISPLMDTIVAVRPRAPLLPFGIPNSLRPLNPAIPIGSPMGFNSVDWQTGQARVPAVTNQMYDFKWEYVWHCHILSHEEMDMMRPIVLNVPSTAPDTPDLTVSQSNGQIILSWTDSTPVNYVTGSGFGDPKSEIGYQIERCTGVGCTNYTLYNSALANQTTFADTAFIGGQNYSYRVTAYNAAGSTISNSVSLIPFGITTASLPNGAVNVAYTRTVTAGGGTAPYTWSATGLPNGLSINPGTGVISGTPTNVVPSNATFATFPVSLIATDAVATTATTTLNLRINQSAPAAPSGLAATATASNRVVLTWTDNANNESVIQVQRATDAGFTTGLTSVNLSGTTLTTYADTTVTTGTTYFYRVRSGNFVAWSTSFSNTASVTPQNFALSISTTSLANGAVNAVYNRNVAATGASVPYTWSATGLPSGLTINPSTGVISGTPANVVPSNATFATFPVSLTVTAANTTTATATLNLRINQTAPVAPSGLAATATASNRVVLTWTDNANNESVVQVQRATDAGFTTGLTSVTLSGTTLTTYADTTVAASTTYFYRVRSGNSVAWSTTFSATANVTTPAAALAITSSSLASGAVNGVYNQTVAAAGGTVPYTWAATGLPGGLTINPSTGVISGIPVNVVPSNVIFATFPVSLTVTDAVAATANTALNLRINQSAPAAPSGLAATAPLPTRVVLTWTDNANNESVVQVQRATDAGFTTGLTSVTLSGTTLTGYTDNTVTTGTSYFYRVRSGNFVAWSTSFSNTVTITTP